MTKPVSVTNNSNLNFYVFNLAGSPEPTQVGTLDAGTTLPFEFDDPGEYFFGYEFRGSSPVENRCVQISLDADGNLFTSIGSACTSSVNVIISGPSNVIIMPIQRTIVVGIANGTEMSFSVNRMVLPDQYEFVTLLAPMQTLGEFPLLVPGDYFLVEAAEPVYGIPDAGARCVNVSMDGEGKVQVGVGERYKNAVAVMLNENPGVVTIFPHKS